MLVARNVGALSQLQTMLRYSRKLSSLNRLLAGVAHEVKNPLNAMTIHLELLRQKLGRRAAGRRCAAGPARRREPPPADGLMSHVSIIGEEIRRLDQVVQGFLRFSRPEELQLEPVSVAALLQDIVDVVRPQAEQQGIVVELEAHQGVAIQVDRAMVRQALLNLALNAIDAMPSGGTLALRARSVEEQQVQIDVVDSGIGIKPDHLGRIFDLYFTTREQGSGLGLSMVYRTVQLHDGDDRSRVHARPRRVVPPAVAPRMTMRGGTLRRTSLAARRRSLARPRRRRRVPGGRAPGCARSKPVAAPAVVALDVPPPPARVISTPPEPVAPVESTTVERPAPATRPLAAARSTAARPDAPKPAEPGRAEPAADAPAPAAPEAAPAPAPLLRTPQTADESNAERRTNDVLGRATQLLDRVNPATPRPAGAPAARDGAPVRGAGAAGARRAQLRAGVVSGRQGRDAGQGPESLTGRAVAANTGPALARCPARRPVPKARWTRSRRQALYRSSYRCAFLGGSRRAPEARGRAGRGLRRFLRAAPSAVAPPCS